MSNQEKKHFLSQYIHAKERVMDISEEWTRIRSSAEKVTPTITDMPSSGACVNDKLTLAIERMEACAEKLSKESAVMHEKMVLVETAINSVKDDTLKRLLELRYINGYTWEQIAVKMNFSYQWVCVLHGRALAQIQVLDSN